MAIGHVMPQDLGSSHKVSDQNGIEIFLPQANVMCFRATLDGPTLIVCIVIM